MYCKIFCEAVLHSLVNRDNYINDNLAMKTKSNRNNIQKTSNVKGNFNAEVLNFNKLHSITLNFC